MKSNFEFNYLTVTVLLLSLLSACRKDDIDNRCKCIDNNGVVVVDTIYHMEYDQAYQLCASKEGTQNIWKCESLKIE